MPKPNQDNKSKLAASFAATMAQLQDFSIPSPAITKVQIACSGGLDSIVLAHLARDWAEKNPNYVVDFALSHLNHCLRREADDDEKLVKKLAAKINFKFFGARQNIAELAAQNKQSLELVARQARLDFFAKNNKNQHFAHVVLAHHLDDNAETICANFLRGGGTSGLAGMKNPQLLKSQPSPQQQLVLWRPLLNFSKLELREFAEKQQLKWHDDASNWEEKFTRNRLRHQLLPLANEIFKRDCSSIITRNATIFSEINDFLNTQAKKQLAQICQNNKICCRVLAQNHPALRRQIIKIWLAEQKIAAIDFVLIDKILQIALSATEPARLNLPQNQQLCRRQKKIFIRSLEAKNFF